MGTRIESAATARRKLLPRGALHLSDVAARTCLERAHHSASELDLLINTGLYKNAGAAEPALASIIQEDIDANPGGTIEDRHGTFSFDLVDGACGVLRAAQLIDGFVGQGNAKLAMIVAADVDPSPTSSRNFPFTAAGGAMLIAHADGDAGFHQFRTRTFAEHAPLFESRLRWDPSAGLTGRGRNVLEFLEASEYGARCIEHAVDVARALLADASLKPSDIDLLIANQYPRAFPRLLARELGIASDRVPQVPEALRSTHTVGPIAALESAIRSGSFAKARHSLFITAGAGITIVAGLYRGEPYS
jgi:3-oxoacyl-[acyl-carrier-protein] synthase-3